MEGAIEYLRSELATSSFASKGQLGEASKAVEPILQALENVDVASLPMRIGKAFREQTEMQIDWLKKAGLKRVIRITAPRLSSKQNKNSFGFTRFSDASREWRECEITAAVLDRFIDIKTGECVIERFDEEAKITLRQSRHIKASDQNKAKNGKKDVYVREHYECPSCGSPLEHIADSTNCPYCGALLIFNFFDWQLDSFYLDMHKSSLLQEIKKVAADKAAGAAINTLAVAQVFADSVNRENMKRSNRDKLGFDPMLGAIFGAFSFFALMFIIAIIILPWYIQLALGVIAVLLLAFGIIKYLKKTDQSRKKKKIVRYSDPYLRSCVYDEIWKTVAGSNLVDFSIDSIILNTVTNTDTTTTIDITASVIKKHILPEQKLSISTEDVSMKLSRARYPERIKNKGKVMEEKACPGCGANFEPDEHHCCSYCGYGLKAENFVWRRTA